MAKARFGRELPAKLARQEESDIWALICKMSVADLVDFAENYETWAHDGQLEPEGDWRNWLMMAGRGYGKTRAGAEWIARAARRERVSIALVAATTDEARAVMVEGESGLLAVCRRRGQRVTWEPALKRLRWRNGSVAMLYSGENPDGLRGGNHHLAWCDELAKWARPEESWDNLQMALRAGTRPRALVTTTPRSIPLLKRIGAEPWTITTGGRMTDNLVLEDQFLQVMRAAYGGTRLGRQELDGELIEDVAGALWTRAMVEKCRLLNPSPSGEGQGVGLSRRRSGSALLPHHNPSPEGEGLRRIVVAVDPPASAAGDACGIVVAGLGADGVAQVIEDATVSGQSPAGWAAAVARAARRHRADRVVAEVNNGGEMVAQVLRSADPGLPVKSVHATRGKVARAEPVAHLYEQGRVRHRGAFPELEDQMCGMTIGGGYVGPGRSPDRADALVWALTELMLGVQAEARVRCL